MKYKYKGIDLSTGQRIGGVNEAADLDSVVRELQAKKIEVLEVEPVKNQQRKGRALKESDMVLPLQELATLLTSGVTLIESVRALTHNAENVRLAEGFTKVATMIESGEKLSTALDASKLPFPRYVTHLVSAGELSGKLSAALEKASEQMQYDQAVKNDLRSALTYPLVLIGAGFGAMLIIFFAVVPKFSHMLDDDKPLPLLAFAVLSAGRYVNHSPLLVFGVIAVVGFTMIVIFTKQNVRTWLMNQLIEAPIIGPWLTEQDIAKWASLTAAMLQSKVSLLQALELGSQSIGFSKRRSRAEVMVNNIQNGQSFSAALEEARLLPKTSLNLVAVGDKTGKLDEMLAAVASLHDKAVKRRMKKVLTLMEPIAILIVGVMIGTMILGVVLAITASTDIQI